IRRLARDAEAAIDREGRVRGPLPGSDARDEIGDLARSYSGVLARLAGYASYREQLAARLAHELRTPLAVVRSSLDHLPPTPPPAGPRGARADGGREPFALRAVVPGCVEAYRVASPQRPFAYHASDEPLP